MLSYIHNNSGVKANNDGDVSHAAESYHNVSLDHSRLKLKNELVIDRGLFVSKKHYALHVISQENKPKDEVDVKGLDIKR